MARTILEMLTSGDVIIDHPGPFWSFALAAGSLPADEFDLLMRYTLDNHPSQEKEPE